jgi:hypothetical protein
MRAVKRAAPKAAMRRVVKKPVRKLAARR